MAVFVAFGFFRTFNGLCRITRPKTKRFIVLYLKWQVIPKIAAFDGQSRQIEPGFDGRNR